MRESQGPAEHAKVGQWSIARFVRDPAKALPNALLKAGILLTSLALAACQTDGSGMASANGGLAFVSIDGPPKPTFDRLVNQLSSEAQTRQVKVAANDDPGAYRVKGYLSMHVERGKASVAYAWDIYDPNKARVARITGEESAGLVKGAAGWAACDDTVLAKIADRSMAELSETLGVGRASGGSSAPAAEPAPATTAAAPAQENPAQENPAQENPAQTAPAQGAEGGAPVASAASDAPALAYAAH
ncbi:hypothetical protein [Xanthobacter sediminis]